MAAAMKTRTLVTNGLEVYALGLGCMGVSFCLGPVGEKYEMIKVIRSAVEQAPLSLVLWRSTGPTQMKALWGSPSTF
jgi:hypothetical protein